MNLLLSIKPPYVQQMIAGIKHYEFRTRIPKHKVDYIYIYQTVPVKMVTHRFKCNHIVADQPQLVWKQCQKTSGMNAKDFFAYFHERKIAYAFQINDFEALSQPLTLADLNVKQAPQSFLYLK